MRTQLSSFLAHHHCALAKRDMRQTASVHRKTEWLKCLTKQIEFGKDVRLCKEALVLLDCVSS